MEHVGKIIEAFRDLGPEIRLSRQKARRAESIELIRRQRDERKQELLFNSRPFLLCGLPIRKPQTGTLLHERRNGNFFLQVCGHPQFGLPYGQDRLVPIWVATKAVRLRSREIRFGAAAEILDELGLPPDGVHYRRLVESFQRVFVSTFYFGSEQHQSVWECARFNYFDRLRLWRALGPGEVASADENTVTRVNPSATSFASILFGLNAMSYEVSRTRRGLWTSTSGSSGARSDERHCNKSACSETPV